jgi:hypothetical protein
VLIEVLDRATLAALQYARQLNPLSITAMHIAVGPDWARELARLWSKVPIPISLEVIDAPDRNLPATVEETVIELIRPDTEVTVLIPDADAPSSGTGSSTTAPPRGHSGCSASWTTSTSPIVPYRLRPRPQRLVTAEDVRAHASE